MTTTLCDLADLRSAADRYRIIAARVGYAGAIHHWLSDEWHAARAACLVAAGAPGAYGPHVVEFFDGLRSCDLGDSSLAALVDALHAAAGELAA